MKNSTLTPMIIQIKTEPVILRTLTVCKEDFFNQNYAQPDKLKLLAHKFAERAIVLCAEIDGQIAGFVAFYANDTVSKTGYISMIIVRNCFRRQGIGKLLLREVVRILREKDFNSIRLEVQKDNASALSFYSRNFFLPEKEASDDTMYYVLPLR